MSDRMKLTITEVKEPRPVGQTEVLDCMATGPDNKTLKYGAWDKAFYPFIKQGAVLDVEVETKTSEKTDGDGNHYVNRKIVQIYIDGKPVKQQRDGFKGGGGYHGKTPEETASIERQTAVKVAADLALGGITNTDRYPLTGQVSIDEILRNAALIFAFIHEGKLPTPVKVDTKPAAADQDFEKLGRKEPATPGPVKEHFCQEHGVPFTLHGKFYSHQKGDASWCNEKK
jgi:hypothetical protein